MQKVYVEGDKVVVEADSAKRYYATFVAAAEALGRTDYEAAEAMEQAVHDKGEYEVA